MSNNYIAERLVRNRMKKLHESDLPVMRYARQVEKILNYQLGDYEDSMTVENLKVLSETPTTLTLEVEYSVSVRIPMYDPETDETYYEYNDDFRTRVLVIDRKDLNERKESKEDEVEEEES